MIARVIESTGATVSSRGAMYKAVAQSVQLNGRERWVMTREMLKVLKALHHWAARRITGMTEKRRAGGEWEYPEVEEEIDSLGLHPISVYINRRQMTISERVDFHPIYALSTEAEQMLGMSRMVRWWYQDVLNEPEE